MFCSLSDLIPCGYNDLTDQQLLREYTEGRSEQAFAELVHRHVDFVYSAALRMVCDAHLAEDVAQGAFVALAQKAPQLSDHPVLSGWLHRTAQNLAGKTVRSEVRRRAREQEAAAMNELVSHDSDPVWADVAPHLDHALGDLNEGDRDALVLRYFQRKSAREMAQTLGVSEAAALRKAAASGNATAINTLASLSCDPDASVRDAAMAGLREAAANQHSKAADALRELSNK